MKRLIAILLSLTMLVCFAACGKGASTDKETTKGTTETKTETAKITITVDVVKSDKTNKTFTIKTDAKNLEDALVDEKLVEGNDSEYGLFITTVDGEKADYDANKSFWNILKDDTALATGAKDTKIADGDHYQLVYTIAE